MIILKLLSLFVLLGLLAACVPEETLPPVPATSNIATLECATVEDLTTCKLAAHILPFTFVQWWVQGDNLLVHDENCREGRIATLCTVQARDYLEVMPYHSVEITGSDLHVVVFFKFDAGGQEFFLVEGL